MIKNKKNKHFSGKFFEEIEKIPESDNYFTPVIEEVGLLVNFKESQVLDVGCGTGLFTKPIISAGCKNCYGVDGPTEFGSLAIKRGYKEVVEVENLCIDSIPYKDEKFDLVVCKDVFEHLLDPLHTLSEIKRVLKPNAYLLLHVPNHFPLLGRFKFLFTNNIDTFSFFKSESRWTFPHIRFYEHNDMLRVFKENGFNLKTDLSFHFGSVPLLSRFGIFNWLNKKLVEKYPNQYAGGFTFLVKKE